MDDDLIERARRRVGLTLNGKYHLDALLGTGGMGSVYRATHRNRAQLAVKVLHPELSLRADVRTRFLREGYAANSVGHPGVVLVVDDDVAEDGSAFLVMELLEGIGVEQVGARFAALGSPPDLAVAVVHQLLEVLAAAHAAGIVHRDVKPANLFLTRDGTLKVLDFGIARVLMAGGNLLSTDAGVPIGTPAFMSPEQARARIDEIDARTDVWAAGATLFTLLTGRLVHEALSANEMLVRAATQAAPSLSSVAPAMPPVLAKVVDRSLAFERDARWPTARAMADALVHAMGQVPDKRALAALVPDRSGTSLVPAERVALESAPTIDGPASPDASSGDLDPAANPPSVATLLAGKTTLPVSSTPDSVPRRGARAWWLSMGAALVLGAAYASSVAVHARSSAVVVAPRQVDVPAIPPRTVPPLLLLLEVANRTPQPMFDGVIEFMAESALMRSPDLYPLSGPPLRALLAEWAPETLEKSELVGHIVAERTGRPVVVMRGAIAPALEGSGYAISLSAIEGSTGATVFSREALATSSARVGPTIAGMACDLRTALHGAPCDEVSRVHTGASDSIEAVHQLVLGRDAHSAGRFAEAIPLLTRAVELAPTFTRARATLGLALWNAGRASEGQTQLDLALARRDMFSDREALQVDAAYFLLRDEFKKAIGADEELLARWPGDTRPRSNLALAYYQQGDFRRALESGLLAKREHPHLVFAQSNVVCYSLAIGDLEQALGAARDVFSQFPHADAALYGLAAAASALLGRPDDARAFRREMAEKNAPSAILLEADFAMFEGRLRDAVSGLREAILADEAAKKTTDAEAEWAMLAEALLRQGNLAAAREAAKHAERSSEMLVSFRVARVLAAVGRPDEARVLGEKIALRPGDRAPLLARLVAADVEVARHAPLAVRAALGDIGTTAGSWLARADLGAADFARGAFEDAERELGLAVQLRGLGSEVFLDDTTTLRYLPPVYYLLARSKDALHRTDAPLAYAAFLALEPDAQDDPLVRDAERRRAASP